MTKDHRLILEFIANYGGWVTQSAFMESFDPVFPMPVVLFQQIKELKERDFIRESRGNLGSGPRRLYTLTGIGRKQIAPLTIKITRDNDANVYTANCDAMGLVCETETLADLFQAMADVAPDLIEANGVEL